MATTHTLKFDLQKALRLSRGAAEAGVAAMAIRYQTEVKQLLSRPGTGRVYQRGSRRPHQASSPGRPPAVDTGAYRRSIQVDLRQIKRPEPTAFVGTNDKRGPMLEFGTRYMAPRPHFRYAQRGRRINNVIASGILAARKAFAAKV